MKQGSRGQYKSDYKGRSDYGGTAGKGVKSDINEGDKGIPPGVQKNDGQMKVSGGISRNVDAGDKGIPPMGGSPTAKPPLD